MLNMIINHSLLYFLNPAFLLRINLKILRLVTKFCYQNLDQKQPPILESRNCNSVRSLQETILAEKLSHKLNFAKGWFKNILYSIFLKTKVYSITHLHSTNMLPKDQNILWKNCCCLLLVDPSSGKDDSWIYKYWGQKSKVCHLKILYMHNPPKLYHIFPIIID